MQKLYVVIRADLKPGAQIAQTGHAVAAFARQHREMFEVWTDGPNNIVCLAIDSEAALEDLADTLRETCRSACVHEPDFADQLTAVAFEGTDEAMRLVSSLPLALRAPKALAAA